MKNRQTYKSNKFLFKSAESNREELYSGQATSKILEPMASHFTHWLYDLAYFLREKIMLIKILKENLQPTIGTNNKLSPTILSLFLISLTSIFVGFLSSQNVSASSVTLTIPSSALSLDIASGSGSVFKKSSAGTINVATDSSYGYSLSIASKTNNDLINGNNKIVSISSSLSESNFQNSGNNNIWGYMPSKLNSSANSDFQPGPTSEPTTIDVTDTSSSGTNYDITLATKIDSTLPAGTYHNTFVLTTTTNDPPYDDIMQNWSGCDALPQETQTLNLLDTRDNKTYTVTKLKDGKCWMTKNLEIENYTLNSSDSDVASEFTLPPSSKNGFNNYDVSNVYIDKTYGGYYTWFAATAGEGTQAKTGETSQSICPKGWRLPTQSEFNTLSIAYGGNNATGGKALQVPPANFLMSGQYYNSSPFSVDSGGYYWSSTVSPSVTSTTYDLYVSDSTAYPSANYNKSNGLSVRCVARYDKKVDTLQNVADWADSVEEGKTALSKDSRDDKEYTVARLADGKLWMTQNLEIVDKTLTSADSDVASKFILPPSNKSGSGSYDTSSVYVDNTYGGYYTWFAATAGEGTQSKSSGDVSHSICPKGWKLPTKQDFIDLDKALGGTGQKRNDSTFYQKYTASPNNFKMGGFYLGSSSPGAVGSRGSYWSATAYPSDNGFAYILYFTSSSIDPAYNDGKTVRFSMRCVAR